MKLAGIISMVGWTFAAVAVAAPDLTSGLPVAGFSIYADPSQPAVRYVGPGEIAIATDDQGRPDVHLLWARHTGTRAAGDAGSLVFRSVLTVGLRQARPRSSDEAEIRRVLGLARTVELRPLPIQRLESVVVYAPVDPASGGAGRTLGDGHVEPSAEPSEEVWSERTLTLRLEPADAQLLWSALEAGRTALSVGYAFFARGKTNDEPVLSGSPQLVDAMRQRLDQVDEATTAQLSVVRAGATAITFDAARFPELLRSVDIDASLPPGYAVLDVYCTDFRDERSLGLYEKDVEIEAQAVSERPTSLLLTFHASSPDVYARSVRFPVAVRFDQPFRYRVIAISTDGRESETEWRVGSWSRILDVSAAFLPQSPEGVVDEN
jgi:hypothetical protein